MEAAFLQQRLQVRLLACDPLRCPHSLSVPLSCLNKGHQCQKRNINWTLLLWHQPEIWGRKAVVDFWSDRHWIHVDGLRLLQKSDNLSMTFNPKLLSSDFTATILRFVAQARYSLIQKDSCWGELVGWTIISSFSSYNLRKWTLLEFCLFMFLFCKRAGSLNFFCPDETLDMCFCFFLRNQCFSMTLWTYAGICQPARSPAGGQLYSTWSSDYNLKDIYGYIKTKL